MIGRLSFLQKTEAFKLAPIVVVMLPEALAWSTAATFERKAGSLFQ